MDYFFIGVDVSKDTFDVCILDSQHEVISKHSVYANSKPGVKEFIEFISQIQKQELWVCLEHTGYYGVLLCSELEKKGIKLSLINPLEIKRSSGLTRGKTDAVDAYRIASYAVKHHYKLAVTKLSTDNIQKLKVKLSQRELLVKVSVQYKNNLKALEVLAKSSNVKEEIRQIKSLINSQDQQIRKLEKAALELIKADEQLIKTYEKITKVIGVGFVTAAICITETENFTKFNDARKFCCHAGLAPFEYQSGTSVRGRTRTSKFRKKNLKSVLYKAANTAANHDPQLKAYKKRKVEEGKHKLSVINALANKVVARIFAVAKRDEPFVKLAA